LNTQSAGEKKGKKGGRLETLKRERAKGKKRKGGTLHLPTTLPGKKKQRSSFRRARKRIG